MNQKLLPPVRKVVIAGNSHQRLHLEDICRLLAFLRERAISVAIDRRFALYLRNNEVEVSDQEITECPPADAGAAISIGGDGTFLRTARWIGRLGIPILGINTGHLGFLASYTPEESRELVDMLYDGNAEVEERMVLRVDVGDCRDVPELPYALNEVAILKEDTSSMINVNVEVNGNYLADYLADGLLVSTPTGSTGYSLSVGGPILFPGLEAICLSPIAPHTLTFRPCVVSGDDVVKARTTTRASQYRLSLDGVSVLMDAGSEIVISKADFITRVIRRPDDSFASTLRHKLLWGVR
ncbi:MAG: NAD(+)/NADH kinase [Muribaculaceae bacterium]|nr:NAD(+)/NADH kinase [Muribaculaceae bacterium]